MSPSHRSLGILFLFAIVTGAAGKLAAQGAPDLPGAVAASASVDGTPEPLKMDLKAGWQTQKEARALTMSIPAPRGQIVDRNGIPLAQNRVAQYLALNFPFLGNEVTDTQILEYAHKRILQANKALGKSWSLPGDRLISHYKNRRWLPLVFSIADGLNEEITPEQQARIKPLLAPGNGLMLQSAYLRLYPKGACAPHIIGYTGKTRPLPLAPIQDGDPLFEETEGREGLEKSFDSDLQGKPGVINVLFNPDGTKMDEQILRRPIPGNNVVTTLDYNFQKYAENALAKNSISSAMVIMDVKTGDILAMASYPFYDLNLFVPGVSTATFKMLNEDKRLPLFARAFRGEYPPASTFKVIVSLAAMESGKINAKTSFNCSSSLDIGDRTFHNWNKEGEGEMNVIGAIKRSCNTWFYQAGMTLGANPITDMAQRLGVGEATGIPLAAEGRGFVPTNAWMMQKLGHKMQGGDIANLSIGQGRTLVTPLQTVQAMAAIADGVNMPQARLVKQIQDSNDRVLQAFDPMIRKRVDLQPEARETVLKGMVAVVNGEGGTGRAAALKECQVAGKTGTAQWKPTEDRNLAWFTGFLPANDPVYAYALVYEGQPNETVSGGKVAAPIVHEVFENVFKNAPPDDPILLMAKNETNKAIAVTDEDEKTEGASSDLSLGTETAPAAPPQAEKKEKGIGGFFKKLFGR